MTWPPPLDDTASPLGEPLLTADQVAGFLQVSRSAVYRLAGTPSGIPVIRVGNARRFRPEDVRAFVERRTRAPKARPGRAERLLRASPAPSRNELASSRQKSVHAKQEPSPGSIPRTPEAAR